MKVIWIDIGHPAQLNFYLNSIKLLSKNFYLLITVLNRGKLPAIAEYELKEIKNIELMIVGKHRNTKFSVIVEANILRFFQLLKLMFRKKVDLHFSNGYLGAMLSRLFNFPSITFGDDPHSSDYRLKLMFAHQVYFCLFSDSYIKLHEKAKVVGCLKEWAYLSPKYFVPNAKALEKYNLKPYEYIFIREVSTGTINYAGQKSGKIKDIANAITPNIKVLFSLEDKSKRLLYPDNWINIKEPANDIHSLIYYSKVLISSGDSMAREAAVLGIPGYYVGVRKMAANEVLKDMVDFYQVTNENLFLGNQHYLKNSSHGRRIDNYNLLQNKFIDVNEFIEACALKYLNNKL
jgi:uncharacterized protein